MLLDCLNGIRGTGWIITARSREQWRDPQLISANHQYQSPSHDLRLPGESFCAICSPSITSSSKVASYADGRLRTTMSIPPTAGITLVRAISRKRLLRRFLSTIVCPCLATITATLACESRESVVRTSRCSVHNRLPAFFTSSRSELRVSLWPRGYPNLLGASVLARQPDSKLLSSLLTTTA